MPLETRLLALGAHLPDAVVANQALAARLGRSAEQIERETGISVRHYAGQGLGPSDLALDASRKVLAETGSSPDGLGLIVFATATPDVCFPGAACFLQDKLGAGTVGAIDVRAQSAGFLAALDLATAFASVETGIGADSHARVLIAAGERMSSGLDETPRGADMTPRFGDGAAACVVGVGTQGARVAALRWYTDGRLADRFWCEYPASRRYPLRVVAEDIEAGRHHPKADLPAIAGVVRRRLEEVCDEVLAASDWQASSLDALVIDYVDPAVARAAAEAIAPATRIEIPTEHFGHVMAAGLPIRLAQILPELPSKARVLLAAAGPGLAWGAAALELDGGLQ